MPNLIDELESLTKSFSDNEEIQSAPENIIYALDLQFPGFSESGKIYMFKYDEVVVIFRTKDTKSLNETLILDLIPLFKKFVLSLQGGLTHEYLLKEIVARQEAENQLHRQELLYRFGANSLTEGLVVVNLKNRITFVNKAIRELTSKTKSELVGQSLDDAFRLKSGEVLSERLIGKNKDFSSSDEFEIVLENSQSFWARITTSNFIDSSGKIVGVIITVLDVTESSKARREKEESQKELRDLVHNIYDAILVVNEDGSLKNSNKAALRLTGYTTEELEELKFNDLQYESDRKQWESHFIKLNKKGYDTGFQGRIVNKNGEVRVVEVNSTAIFEGDKFIGSREIFRDISDRKKLEEQQALSEKKLRLIIEQALDAVVTLDIGGRVLEWNPRAESIFKISADEAKGKKIEDLIFSDWQKSIYSRAMANFEQLSNSNQFNERVELVGTDSTGRSFPIEFSVAPVSQGDLIFYSAFIRDITERKSQEEETARLLEELGSANQELKDFAYIVSHDLKAPLRSVGSLADWLIQDYAAELDGEGNMLLTLLRQRIRRMHNLIEGVLQYSKLGRIQNDKELVDVEELLNETLDSLDPATSIHITIADNLPSVMYDRIRLQQVFQNLISNAIKFLDKPIGKIDIGLKETNTHYIFLVKDNGPGIDEAHFNKIFKIFQTLQSRDEYESTGIGLSIVKRIVELNNGKVDVQSEKGVGSTFSFSVPKLT